MNSGKVFYRLHLQKNDRITNYIVKLQVEVAVNNKFSVNVRTQHPLGTGQNQLSGPHESASIVMDLYLVITIQLQALSFSITNYSDVKYIYYCNHYTVHLFVQPLQPCTV